MEPKPRKQKKIEKDYEEPDYNRFKKILLIAMAFIPLYAGFLIWRNYYGPNAKPLQRKEAPAPYYNLNKDSLSGTKK